MRDIVGALRRAVIEYKMIENGDHIVVGVSGGKDSVVLAKALSEFKKYGKIDFKLSAVNIDIGFREAGFPIPDESAHEQLRAYIESLEIDYYVEKTNIAEVVFIERKEKSPCSLCSRMRRGALSTKCIELGAKKLALGHHAEDVLETFLLSFLYEGRLSTFQPYSFMDRTEITLIRPFIYVSENEIKNAVNNYNIPTVKNPCPVDKLTKRQYMKELIQAIQKDIPFAKERMYGAITSPQRYNLWDKCLSDDKDNLL